MNKSLFITLLLFSFVFSACSQTASREETPPPASEETSETPSSSDETAETPSSSGNAKLAALVPSREPHKGCEWEEKILNDVSLRLLYQKCSNNNFEEFKLKDNSLGKESNNEFFKEIEIFTKNEAQSPEDAIKEQIISQLPEAEQNKCIVKELADKSTEEKTRYHITGTEEYIKELAQKSDGPILLCGEYGTDTGIQYFEFHKDTPDKFLFLRIGQELPFFDEETIEFLPSHHIMDNI